MGNPDKLRLSAFIDEVERRALTEMAPQVPSEFGVDKAASLSNQMVFYYMLTSAKSALVQMTQLPVVGLPTLAAKYGLTDTLKAAARYSNLYDKLGTTKKDAAGNIVTHWGQPTIHDSSYVRNHPNAAYGKVLQRAWQTAQDQDIFMTTFAADMTSRSRVPSEAHGSVLNRGGRAALQLMGGAFHHSERITREIMYMSTFELEYARAKKEGDSDAAAFDRSTKQATTMLFEALFNYTQFNKPRIMKPALARIGTQFLSYPIQVTSFLLRNFYGTLKFLSPKEQREAAIKFFGTLGITWLFAGTAGLPLYSVMMGFAEGIRDSLRDEDDDELDPDDEGNPLGKRSLDFWFRNWFLEKHFGDGSALATALGLTPEQADMVQRGVEMGPISAALDVNIGASVSLDGLWFHDDVPSDTAREAFGDFLIGLTGPTGGMVMQGMGAIDDFNSGDFNRGVEKLLPAFFRGAAKSMRLSEEGETTKQGAVIRDATEYTTGKLLAQSLGFQSATTAEIQKSNFIAKGVVREILTDRTKVLNAVDRAYRNAEAHPGDPKFDAALETAIDDLYAFNDRNGITSFAITKDTVKESLENKAKGREIGSITQGLTPKKDEAEIFLPLLPGLRTR
jgi:hypothetical protein